MASSLAGSCFLWPAARFVVEADGGIHLDEVGSRQIKEESGDAAFWPRVGR